MPWLLTPEQQAALTLNQRHAGQRFGVQRRLHSSKRPSKEVFEAADNRALLQERAFDFDGALFEVLPGDFGCEDVNLLASVKGNRAGGGKSV